MNFTQYIAEARATALTLRASARACTSEQGSLKFRLMRAAECLDGMVLLAVRALDRIEELQRQLAARSARGPGLIGRPDLSRSATRLPDAPIAPVIIGGVDVAPLAVAARILHMIEVEIIKPGAGEAGELAASLQAARTIVEEVLSDLRAASAGGPP